MYPLNPERKAEFMRLVLMTLVLFVVAVAAAVLEAWWYVFAFGACALMMGMVTLLNLSISQKMEKHEREKKLPK